MSYSWAVDTGDGEALSNLFTSDGKFQGADGSVTQGADDLRKFAVRVHESRPYHLQHIAFNHQFRALNTTTVEVRSYVHVYTGSADGPQLLGMGTYLDTVEHTSDRWLFKERRFESLGRTERAATQPLGG
ncbi:nuclear transport factor 2 family protein [Arthrobacter sp. CDRTa11]|uniref:nuclear transport factor 2 family protein n=1 Tax=Arthrobacter sp. CDRTa11 TaxID=2651199 RepID=UPI002265C417|nr:nuclear transport factor 2 family protein [Arthrobacter sp. CDRTa11]